MRLGRMPTEAQASVQICAVSACRRESAKKPKNLYSGNLPAPFPRNEQHYNIRAEHKPEPVLGYPQRLHLDDSQPPLAGRSARGRSPRIPRIQ